MKTANVILYFLIGVLVAQSGFYYTSLPEAMASHFNANGAANNWLPKDLFFICGFLLIAFLVILPHSFEKMPDSLIKLPNKDFWLAPERRTAAMEIVKYYFEWLNVWIFLLFIAVNQLIFKANIEPKNIAPLDLRLISGIFLAALFVWFIAFTRKFKTL